MDNKIKKFSNLEKWHGTLANCIRCGYCYEHCPMFKYTGWESDAPRAKIITAFGLLSGEIDPTESAADKLFSCFFCGRCEAACSSGVALTQIFIDARKDLIQLGLNGPGTTSTTKLNCARCLMCVSACPHEARFYDGSKIATDPTKCQSCGICLEVCPAGAAEINKHFGTDKACLMEKASNFLTGQDNSKAVIFACNWSYYPDLQSSILPESETKNKEYEIFVNMCGGRLDAQVLMAPFLNNAWGVMAACCTDGDCRHDGNLRAKKTVKRICDILSSIDINPERVRLIQVPPGDKDLFQAQIDTFMADLNKMGPIR